MARLVVVFAKPPRPGAAKTRLAPSLGADGAARLACALLDDALTVAGSVGPVVLATTDVGAAELPAGVERWDQGDGDLGARMARCLARGVERCGAAAILGADAPTVTGADLAALFAALRTHDVALGPTLDGGFWCIATRVSELDLRDLPWSTPRALAETAARLRARGLRVALGPVHADVDTPEDLVGLRRWLAGDPEAAPATRGALAALGRLRPVRLSVVIPTWNEAARIAHAVRAARALDGVDEVVVSDGGSPDGTARIAETAGARVVTGAKGRGAQLDAGAAAADGEVLWFVHADCRLPPDGAREIERVLAAPDVVGGAFKLWTLPDDGPWWSAPWLHIADLRSRVTRYPYGDQALFCRRDAFVRAGGYQGRPLMEDLALAQSLRRLGRLARVDRRVIASGRRFAAQPVRSLVTMNVFPTLYRLGVAPERLAAWYRDPR
jgi:rSAM/selenodomain-associated transferase 2/rSAM/selenodomain-associated transferase 1